MQDMMNAARLHNIGGNMQIDSIPVPDLRPNEVLVKVEASNVVQNLPNILNTMGEDSAMAFPRLPAVFGLDSTGTIVRCGDLVCGLSEGMRVYINPLLFAEGSAASRAGRPIDCEYFALRGYFGFGDKGQASLDRYPQGGFAQYIAVPQHAIVTLPDHLDFDTASRFGYLGTAYRALKLGGCDPTKTVLINGISGTLGLGAVALALAMGARTILGTAQDESLFGKVEALGPKGRIHVLKSGTQDTQDWARTLTDGAGVDIVIDALGGDAPPEPTQQALYSLKRGGCLVNIGAVQGDVPLPLFWAMSNNLRIIGSTWFTTGDAQEMSDMVKQGCLDLSFFDNRIYALADINKAIEDTETRNGGFSNFVIHPN